MLCGQYHREPSQTTDAAIEPIQEASGQSTAGAQSVIDERTLHYYHVYPDDYTRYDDDDWIRCCNIVGGQHDSMNVVHALKLSRVCRLACLTSSNAQS